MSQDTREPALKLATDAEMAVVLKKLVKNGCVDPEVVNGEIDRMRADTAERANAALEKDDKQLSAKQQQILLKKVKSRFEANMHRHDGVEWTKVRAKLEANPQKLWSLNEMERTGGEPDVVKYNKKNGKITFYDCSKETPEFRRNICYDRSGQYKAICKNGHPEGNAVDMAAEMGIEILNRMEYMELQELGQFDFLFGSWIKTSVERRKTGKALVGRKEFMCSPVFEREADDYQDNRGFRGSLSF